MTLLLLLVSPNDQVELLERAWSLVHADPASLTPDEIIAAGTAATVAELAAATSDDGAAWGVQNPLGTESLDQSQTTDDTDAGPITDMTFGTGQTFTAGAGGALTRVAWKGRVASAACTLVCKLYSTSGGTMTSTVLATSDSLVISNTADADLTFTFSTPPVIEAGTVYGIGIFLASPSATGYILRARVANVYAGGGRCLTFNSGATWSVPTTLADEYFKTYVTPYTAGKIAHLFQLGADRDTVDAISLTYIGYGSDVANANAGVTLYAWDGDSWAGLGSNSAVAADADSAKTIAVQITSSPADYVDADGLISLLAVTTYAGTSALGAQLATDAVLLSSYAEADSDDLTGISYGGALSLAGISYEGSDSADGKLYEGSAA